MLETPVSSLLNLLDGKSDEIPNVIQQLCGKQLIFKFKLSEQNLTEGTPNYVVKRTFVPDYMLEKQYLINKTEEVKQATTDFLHTKSSKFYFWNIFTLWFYRS